MIRFHSKAGADILMLRAHADAVLSALGRDMAPQGIFEPTDIGAALAHWDQRRPAPDAQDPEEDAQDAPVLARRAWPLLQLLRRARDASVVVTWSSS
jgi:Domain of unknown function (DUF1840)